MAWCPVTSKGQHLSISKRDNKTQERARQGSMHACSHDIRGAASDKGGSFKTRERRLHLPKANDVGMSRLPTVQGKAAREGRQGGIHPRSEQLTRQLLT